MAGAGGQTRADASTGTPPAVPHLIGGAWRQPDGVRATPVHNPSTGAVIAEVAHASAPLVDEVVRAADRAFPAWAATPVGERARILLRYASLLEQHFDELARLVTREHGKTLGESRGDVRRGVEMVEYACGAPELLKGESLANVARGIDCQTLRFPLGVTAGICPYNFPAMVPLWMVPLALACGNTFVLKPSEKVPLTANRLAELLLEAGLPAGVLSVVHGSTECVDALLAHPLVRSISFVGSSPVAEHVYRTGSAHGKRVQAAGGAKNFVYVLPDADPERAVQGLIDGAFGCAGQRCMAASTAVMVGDASHERVMPLLAERTRVLAVGRTDDAGSDGAGTHEVALGALITLQHRERVAGLVARGLDEGARLVVDGRDVTVAGAPLGFYLGACILDSVEEDMTVAREEIFGPVLNVMRCPDLDAALELASRQSFGNGACIFTTSGHHARTFAHEVKAGMVGINVGVPAPLAYFPFSGWDGSFFGDLHMQGREGVAFYTRQKVVTSRWPGQEGGGLAGADQAGDVWQR